MFFFIKKNVWNTFLVILCYTSFCGISRYSFPRFIHC
nr:MAG TPA: hypothetical protein [Caudoviricetes sp.]